MPLSVADRREALRVLADKCLSDIGEFSRLIVRRPLRAYQQEALRGILPCIETPIPSPEFTVMMARQGGKNESSAHLEAFLMNRHQRSPSRNQIVKAAPTFKPQIVTSKQRLEDTLDNWWNTRAWKSSFGYIVSLGKAKTLFFSADKQANVVGSTASLLLEVDEAQDIDSVKFSKDFAPMASTTNAPRVFYGTSWTDDTLLAQMKAQTLDLEKRDGIRRHFEYPWEKIAEHVPAYGEFVQSEIARLGFDHPIVQTQYRLLTIAEKGQFIGPEAQMKLRGKHQREQAPTRSNFQYIMGIDIAGSSEVDVDDLLRILEPRKDSTVVTIARLDWSVSDSLNKNPRLQVVDHYWWTGQGIPTQYRNLVDIITRWNPEAIVCDATGMGASVAEFLGEHFGTKLIDFVFNQTTKSDLGFNFLAAVNTDRFKMYQEVEASKEAKQFWFEIQKSRYEVKGPQKINFFVPENVGHDDFVMSAALCAWGAKYVPFAATIGAIDFFNRGRR